MHSEQQSEPGEVLCEEGSDALAENPIRRQWKRIVSRLDDGLRFVFADRDETQTQSNHESLVGPRHDATDDDSDGLIGYVISAAFDAITGGSEDDS